MNYPILLSPGNIGNVTIRNRTVMTAMGCSLANLDGSASDEIIAYYSRRAKGGVGLIINEITRIDDETGVGEPKQLSVTKDEHIPGLKKLTDAVHAEGAKIFCQLHHPGRQTSVELNKADKLVSASDVVCNVCKAPTRALTIDEIHAMVEKFSAGAARAQAAGYDGVELHAAHGYLLNQFLSPHTNKRADEYGGSVENRVRFIVEIIDAIHERCGKAFPICVRISVDECYGLFGFPVHGLELTDSIKMCRIMEAHGIDALNVSVGTYETMNTVIEPNSFKEGWRSDFVKAVKENVSIPVIGNAVIRHPDFAEKLLEKGYQDFIGMGRTWLADPDWLQKAAQGRESEIRKCICCLYCFETLQKSMANGEPIKCALNPCAGHEYKYGSLKEDGAGRMVAVIGAGPAGMEAARILALRKFKPVIFEAKACPGGQLNVADKPPAKERISELTDRMVSQLKALGVEIRCNSYMNADSILKLNPYGIVVATGGAPIIPKSIKGITSTNVHTNEEILSGHVKLSGKKVAVIGGSFNGLETAEFLAENGNEVTVIEMAPSIGADIYFQVLIDLTTSLNKLGVNCIPNRQLLAVDDNGINVKNVEIGNEEHIPIDDVVLSVGTRSVSDIISGLQDFPGKVVCIGDAETVGRIAEATRSAYEAAANL